MRKLIKTQVQVAALFQLYLTCFSQASKDVKYIAIVFFSTDCMRRTLKTAEMKKM